MNERGYSWAELRSELMTPEEIAESDRKVKALGELLDARDAGKITRTQFNAAFNKLNRSPEERRRLVAEWRMAVRALRRVPRVAL